MHIAQIIIIILLSLLFLHLDANVSWFHRYRQDLSVVVSPIQFLVAAPGRLAQALHQSVRSNHQLIVENEMLKARQLLLDSKLQKMMSVEQQNKQLRAMLSSASQLKHSHVQVASLLAVDLNPAQHQWLLNAGRFDHLYVGQPVLDAYGVLGFVIDVSPNLSRVLLLSDQRARISVQDTRNDLRAIAAGTGEWGQMRLLNVEASADFKPGDVLVTSGLGMRYPVGYPVGRISSVIIDNASHTEHVTVKPLAHPASSTQVLLVWHHVMLKSKDKQLLKQDQSLIWQKGAA